MSEKNKVINSGNDKSDDVDLGRLLGELVDNRWLIIGVTALFLTLGILYCLFATPIYRADAMVQVEQNAGNSLLNNISQILPNNQPESAPEIELLRSRMILSKTVEDLNLRIVIAQEYFPVFGKGYSRLVKDKPGEISITKLEIPNDWIDDPSIVVTSNGDGTFSIKKDGAEIA